MQNFCGFIDKISPLSIFDVEVFADEETERAEGAEDEEEEGGKELRVKIVLAVSYWQNY